MPLSTHPPEERRRLAALRKLGILDTPREDRFDRITRLAAALLDVPIALVSLVDGDRHWFKSAHGIDVVETPRDSASFCGYAIQSDLPFIVSNALLDSRFAGNPIVAGEINIRFYAGHPLKTPDGNRVGTLCVMDRKPRTLGASQMALLDDLANIAEDELNSMRQNATAHARLAAIVEHSDDAIYSRTFDGTITSWNAGAEKMLGYTASEAIGQSGDFAIPPGRPSRLRENLARLLGGERVERETDRMTKDGRIIHVLNSHSPIRDHAGNIVGASIIARDITALKEAQAALKENEARFRATFDQAAIGIAHYDLENRAIKINRRYAQITGYTEEELLGKPPNFLSHPDDHGSGREQRRQLLAGAIPHFSNEKRYVRKDGSVIWVTRTESLVRDDNGTPLYIIRVIEDISERKHIQEELNESKTRFRDIAEATGGYLWEIDLDCRYTFVSERSEHLFGYLPEEMLGRTAADFMPPGEIDRVRAWIAENRSADGAVRFLEHRSLDKSGRIFWQQVHMLPLRDVSDKHIGFHGTGMDITERKRIEDWLKLTQFSIDRAVDSVFWIKPDSRIVYANDAACRTLGYKREQIVGKTVPEIDPHFPAEKWPAHWEELKQRKSLNFESDHYTADGKLIHTEVTANYIEFQGQEYNCAFMRDITERKQAEAARVSLETQLRESQKMQAIGTLAGGIAHDFNNIIAIILGNVALALEDIKQVPHALVSLERIQLAGERARDIVRQILAFSRRQPTARKPLVLIPVMTETARLLRATLPARVSLEWHCDPDVPPVLADATQMQQVLINLATNAMQAMPGAGHIELRVETAVLDAALINAHPHLGNLQIQCAGNAVRLVVRDNGTGMDAATRERIFEPFFTTKPVGEGTGLGLSVVHGIVTAHGGAITVESQPGQGATFALYLPPASQPASVPAEASRAAASPEIAPDSGPRILYIDDNTEMVSMVRRLLERQGYRISAHTDARTAVGLLRADPAAFDLVLTDYNMPGMSGLDIAETVRSLRADLPVAVTSGFIDETLQAKAVAAGVCELIFKADTVQAFCDAVQRLTQKLVR